MRQLRQFIIPLVCVGLLLPGCNRLPEGETVAEINEPAYEEGKRLIRQGREQAALASFARVIESRKDGAPESHLEVGLLYENEVKDPIRAIYHFRRYLELKPNSPQADLVRGRIEGATRDFARTLPAQPLENQTLRNDLLDVVDRRHNVPPPPRRPPLNRPGSIPWSKVTRSTDSHGATIRIPTGRRISTPRIVRR